MPLKLKKAPALVPTTLLEEEVTVEEETLAPGQPALVRVQMVPAGLHHADPRITEGGQDPPDQVGRCDEVRVEDEKEVSSRSLGPVGQGASLEAGPRPSAHMLHCNAPGSPPLGQRLRDAGGAVGGVVQDLHVEAVTGIILPARRIHEPFDDVELVVDGQLDCNPRKLGLGPGVQNGRLPPSGEHQQIRPVQREGKEQGEHTCRENQGDVGQYFRHAARPGDERDEKRDLVAPVYPKPGRRSRGSY